jgi:DNA (cytosine-5)-methyltransferase 1
MKHGSLFSGIGGFDLAAEWMGWDNIFHCEWNPFGKKILNYYWPNSISYEDITKTDFTIHRGSIDILTGGFPCQPYSMAGKRKGKEDERHLWPEMLRAIREIQPRWIVGENVRGLVNWSDGMVFDEVQADLEDAGYEVMPFLLPAAAVNAPHRRDRIWFVAYNKSMGRGWRRSQGIRRNWEENEIREGFGNNQRFSESRITSDTDCNGFNFCGISRQVSEAEGTSSAKGGEFGIPATPICDGLQPNWENFPTQSPICGGDDGIPTRLDGITFSKWRNESIKGYGNAIVPQVVYEIFKAIEEYEQHLRPATTKAQAETVR